MLRPICETSVIVVEVGYGWHSRRDGGCGAGTGTWDVPEKKTRMIMLMLLIAELQMFESFVLLTVTVKNESRCIY